MGLWPQLTHVRRPHTCLIPTGVQAGESAFKANDSSFLDSHSSPFLSVFHPISNNTNASVIVLSALDYLLI
jgi:hypothetical protein